MIALPLTFIASPSYAELEVFLGEIEDFVVFSALSMFPIRVVKSWGSRKTCCPNQG
jgi:hypothetical protein